MNPDNNPSNLPFSMGAPGGSCPIDGGGSSNFCVIGAGGGIPLPGGEAPPPSTSTPADGRPCFNWQFPPP